MDVAISSTHDYNTCKVDRIKVDLLADLLAGFL